MVLGVWGQQPGSAVSVVCLQDVSLADHPRVPLVHLLGLTSPEALSAPRPQRAMRVSPWVQVRTAHPHLAQHQRGLALSVLCQLVKETQPEGQERSSICLARSFCSQCSLHLEFLSWLPSWMPHSPEALRGQPYLLLPRWMCFSFLLVFLGLHL